MDGEIASETFLGEAESLAEVRRFVTGHFPEEDSAHLALLADELAIRAVELAPSFRLVLSVDRDEVAIEISMHTVREGIDPQPGIWSKTVVDGLSTCFHLASSNGSTQVWACAPMRLSNGSAPRTGIGDPRSSGYGGSARRFG